MNPVRNITNTRKQNKISNGVNIAILASGNGSNFEALAKAANSGYLKAKIKLLISDKRNALVRKRAKKFKIKDVFINPKDYSSSLKFDQAIVKLLKKEKINLVVLAGYMRILTPYFVNSYKNKILNIHPALLPSFKGTDSIQRAYRYGCKLSGVTVHLVDDRIDHGPIILQEAVVIKKGMNLEALEKAIHRLEHKLYPRAIKLFIERRLKLKGRSVTVI